MQLHEDDRHRRPLRLGRVERASNYRGVRDFYNLQHSPLQRLIPDHEVLDITITHSKRDSPIEVQVLPNPVADVELGERTAV